MFKPRTGNDQSVQTVACAICGRAETFVTQNTVVSPAFAAATTLTSKTGSSSVAAGRTEMSHESSFPGWFPLCAVAPGVIAARTRMISTLMLGYLLSWKIRIIQAGTTKSETPSLTPRHAPRSTHRQDVFGHGYFIVVVVLLLTSRQ